MKTTRRAFLQWFGAAAVGLTLALPTHTWSYAEGFEAALRATANLSKPVGGAIDVLVQRSMAKRARLVA